MRAAAAVLILSFAYSGESLAQDSRKEPNSEHHHRKKLRPDESGRCIRRVMLKLQELMNQLEQFRKAWDELRPRSFDDAWQRYAPRIFPRRFDLGTETRKWLKRIISRQHLRVVRIHARDLVPT